jgi:hypothetical protein
MTIENYIAAKGAREHVIHFEDPLNNGFRRKLKLTGVQMLEDFKLEDHSPETRLHAYIEAGGQVTLYYFDIESDEGERVAKFDRLQDLLHSIEPENVKSAIASELEEDYFEVPR